MAVESHAERPLAPSKCRVSAWPPGSWINLHVCVPEERHASWLLIISCLGEAFFFFFFLDERATFSSARDLRARSNIRYTYSEGLRRPPLRTPRNELYTQPSFGFHEIATSSHRLRNIYRR